MNLVLPAPAKINLSLRVLRKRGDGFHEIDTVMVKLPGLADEIEFREAAEFAFSCDDPSVPSDESNLVVSALRAFEAQSGVRCTHAIELRKRIPHGAGLGGGSSDAAAALLGLNQLYGHPLSVPALHEIAGKLGSDVPFFLTSGAARCTGRGEIIEAISAPPTLSVLLLKPEFAVATPGAYARWSTARDIPGISYEPQEHAGFSWKNDLERPTFEKHRFLAELKQWLLQRDETAVALMCGSGSTIFAVLEDGAKAGQLAAAAQMELDSGLWSWTGKTGG